MIKPNDLHSGKIKNINLLLIMAGAAFVILLASRQCVKKEINITESQLHLSIGQTTSIALPSNPTTGYSWELQPFNTELLELIEHTYIADKRADGMVGVGGTERWQIKALKPGKTKLEFHYQRPWEKDKAPAKTHVVQVNII